MGHLLKVFIVVCGIALVYSQCSGGQFQKADGTCVSSCLPLFTNAAGTRCIDACETSEYYIEETKRCVSACPDTCFLDVNICKLCSSSVQNCLKCTKGTSVQCTTCNPNYYIIDATKTCATTCTATQYSAGDKTTGQAKCIECSTDITQCSSCTLVSDGSQLNCNTCNNNFLLKADTNNQCLSACSSGYVEDGNKATGTGKCRPCSDFISNCGVCSSKTVCTQCSAPFLLYSNICQSKTCPAGFYSDGKACQACHSSCAECSSSTLNSCTKCKLQTYLNPDGSCKASCVEGTYPEGLVCKKCDGACSTCSGSSSSCTACISPYLFDPVGKTCSTPGACPEGTFESGKVCAACGPNCKTCSGAEDYCTSCRENRPFLEKNACLVCPSTVTNCEKCAADGKCETCTTGFYIDKSKGLCMSSCPRGTYPDSRSMTCISCSFSLPNCASCSSANVCSECNSGYFTSLPTNTTCSVCSKSNELRIREGGCLSVSTRVVLSSVVPEAEITTYCGIEGDLSYILTKSNKPITSLEMQRLQRTSPNATVGTARLLKTSNYNVKTVFTGLETDSTYYFSAFCVSSFGALSENPITASFSFKDNQAKDIILNLQLSEQLSTSQRRILACNVADILSLNKDLVTIQDGTNCNSPLAPLSGRALQQSSGVQNQSYPLLLFIAKDSKQLNNNQYLGVVETLASQQFLNSLESKLNGSKIVSFNTTEVAKKESVVPVAVLNQEPTLSNTTVTIKIESTNSAGVIYVAIEEDGFSPKTPSPEQLRRGVNFLDTPFMGFQSLVAAQDEVLSFRFQGIKRLNNYTVFYAAGSLDVPSRQVLSGVQLKQFRAQEFVYSEEGEKGYNMEERRNIAIGIGVGLGGFILIVSLICACLVTKTKSSDKYELTSEQGGSKQVMN